MPDDKKKYTKQERVWNFILYGAKQHIVRDLYDAEENQVAEKSEAEKKRIQEQNRQTRIKQGFPAKVEISPEVDRMEEYLRDDIEKGLIGLASEADLMECYRILGELSAKISVEFGKEQERIKGRMGDSKYKEQKACILAAKSQSKANHLDEQFATLRTDVSSIVSTIVDDDVTAKYLQVFEKAYNDARTKMSPEDQKYFDTGTIVRKCIVNEQWKLPEYNNDELKEFALNENRAKKIARQRDVENNARAYKELGKELTPSVMANVKKFDTSRVDTTFMRGIVNDLEATGTGRSDRAWYEKIGRWHRSNSKEFDDMMKDIKNYIGMVEANEDGKKLFMYQNKMIESIKKYISGKETLREHEFGQKRFDDALYLLSQVMPEQEFDRTILKSINDARHRANDFDHDVSLRTFYKDKYNPSPNSEYGRLRRLGLKGMDEVQKATQEYATNIPEHFKNRWMDGIVEAVLCQNPKKSGEISDQFVRDGHNYANELFKPIKDEFKAIGKYTREDRLSDKDFVALAYLGSNTHVEYLNIPKDPRHDVKKYAQKFENGRQKAADALRKYEAGDKEPLARLIAEGIKRLTAGYQNKEGLSDSILAKREMMARAMNMMQRDPELAKLAMDKEVGGLTKNDLENMKGVMRGAEVVGRAMEAKNKLDSHKDMNKEETIKAYTDLETYVLINYSMLTHKHDPKQYKHNLGMALSSEKSMKELRANVKEIVKQNKMQNYSDFDRQKHLERGFNEKNNALEQIGQKMPQVKVQPAPKKVVPKKPEKNAVMV